MTCDSAIDRASLVRRGRRLEYLTLAWNSLEAIAALVAGIVAASISLVGFGIDSLIEMISGAAILWRMTVDGDVHRRERNERTALRIVGACFLALAAYIAFESLRDLWQRTPPRPSPAGIVLAGAASVVMPMLARAKRKVGSGLRSAAMHADATQSSLCAYLAAILLAGLLLNAWFRWWWADPLAALVMVPIIAREGIEALQGKPCDDCAP
jgi:divalent metal cation (Fe/Co/Zn/Cd) transporter